MANIELIKLKETIPTDGVKIIELYNKIENDLLITQPNYQRKLVWKKQHKYAFIETILLNYPFPEIYIASSDMDIVHMKTLEVVVDGQQRLTTIVEYIKGEGDFKKQNRITPFDDLPPDSKKEFLNYKVSVKDMKDVGDKLIKEIFQRINSTEYSLNTVEKNNAQYGDGEIAIFCKQLVDIDYQVNENETDIILDSLKKNKVINFFSENKVFSENDKKRMYDFQYIMLLISTIIEGHYYGRSSKVDEYLEKYNSEFEAGNDVLDTLIHSITTISKLNLSDKSYWFNKANLFTLIIELSRCEVNDLDLERLEIELLDLEEKVDIYFSAESEEEICSITDEERKYFEVARQGSHEKSAREHRGKVIKAIIENSLKKAQATEIIGEDLYAKNSEQLKSKNIDFEKIIPTTTGLKKSIMDATSKVREFLNSKGIHNYENQAFGPSNKVVYTGSFVISNFSEKDTNISLYRSNGRGDYRIWFSELSTFADPQDQLLILEKEGKLIILNASKIDYAKYISAF